MSYRNILGLRLIFCRSFMNVISELDHPLITEEWIRLTTQKGRRSFALRLRNPWIDEATGTPRQKWILCSCGKNMLITIRHIFLWELFQVRT